jgi:hypothetical protein
MPKFSKYTQIWIFGMQTHMHTIWQPWSCHQLPQSKFSLYIPDHFFAAMERAQTSEVESSVEIIVVSIVSGLVVVILVSVVVYMGCFKAKPARTAQQQHDEENADESQKTSQKLKKKGEHDVGKSNWIQTK